MKTSIFNSFSGAYSLANTVVTLAFNKGLPQDTVEMASIASVMNSLTNNPPESFGRNTMELYGHMEAIKDRTYFQSMVVFAALSVTEELLVNRGLTLSNEAMELACSIHITRKIDVAKRLDEVKSRMKAARGKTEQEMAEMAMNDEGGCSGGACKL